MNWALARMMQLRVEESSRESDLVAMKVISVVVDTEFEYKSR